MTDPSKRYWITEQGMKEAAKKIADFQRTGDERGLLLREHIIAKFIAAHSEAASPPMTEAEARKWCDDHRKHPVIGKAIQGAQSWQPDGLATIIAYVFSLAAPPQGTPEPEKHLFSESEDDAVVVRAENICGLLEEFRQAVNAVDGTSARKFENLKLALSDRSAPQGTPAPEPDKCPECGSDNKNWLRVVPPEKAYTNSAQRDRDWLCTHPWHSTVAAQKEKP